MKRFVVLYTAQKLKKDKIWQDGELEIDTTGSTVTLKDDKGRVLVHGERINPSLVHPETGLELGAYMVQVEGESTTGGGSEVKHRRFKTMYTTDTTSAASIRNWLEGHVEHDGKSLAVFKDATGKELVRKVCAGINRGEIINTSRYIIEVLDPIDGALKTVELGNKRKTLVSRTASAAAASQSTESITQGQKHGSHHHEEEEQKDERVMKCIYTEDKHKKQKKWIDATLSISKTNYATIEDNDSGQVIYKRQFSNPDLLIDGYEFDGGRYRFQITEPSINDIESSVIMKRKQILLASELIKKKNRPIVDNYENIENNITGPRQSFTSKALKRKKGESLLDLFDDY